MPVPASKQNKYLSPMDALKKEYETESHKLTLETLSNPKESEIEVFEIKNRESTIVKQEESVKVYSRENSQNPQFEERYSLLNTPMKEVFPALQPSEEHFDNLFRMYEKE